ncbi:MAG: BON domain-containing protein [Candidatus Acidiferrales bacterium]
MKHKSEKISIFIATAAGLLGLALSSGCNNQHPDEKDAVTSALKSNNLGDLSVSQDRDKGVMTLTGDVQTPDQKQQAENLAKQAAPGYTVADEIGVRPPATANQASSVQSSLDSAIEDNYKAEIKGHKALDDQNISCTAKNGTLVLKGSVKTAEQKHAAEALAKKVPNVQQVVNEIEVKPGKHSTNASS